MEFTGLGSGVLLALAAVLWLAYLVPSWLRRHEYLSTERNALRLQQTIRVLAETAEVPVAIRAETSARSVAAQQRALRRQQQQHELRRQAQQQPDAVNRAQTVAAGRSQTHTTQQPQTALARRTSASPLAARRLRRTRAVTSLILVASFTTLITQATLMITTGIAPAAPTVLTGAALMTLTAFTFLGRLSAISRRRYRMATNAVSQPRRRTTSSGAPAQRDEQQQRVWTPVAMPKPLYLSRDIVERELVDQQSAVAELVSAAAQSDRALRSAQATTGTQLATRQDVDSDTEQAAQPGRGAPVTVSRFATMGIIDRAVDHDDAASNPAPNLDDVLRRRRQAAS